MGFTDIFTVRWLGVAYTPRPEERSFLERAQVQQDQQLQVRVAVLDHRESERVFGVPLARRGIQPVWLQITNHGDAPFRLRLASIDPNYYPPLEAAFINHFKIGRRLLAFGFLAWMFLPLVILVPFKVLGARITNRRMNAYFVDQGIGWGLIQPGGEVAGFIFTTLDEGTKQFSVKLQGAAGVKDFSFSIPVPGLRIDHHDQALDALGSAGETFECDADALRSA